MDSGYNIKSVHDHIIRIRQRYLCDSSGKLLDHGFGNGVLSHYFIEEGFDVYGVELKAYSMLDYLFKKNLNNANFKLIDVNEKSIPFSDSFFNVVVSNQVLNFLPNREYIDNVINEFMRILKPGGKLVITVMSENHYFFLDYGIPPIPMQGNIRVKVRGRIERDRIYYRFKDSEDLVSTLRNTGFLVDDIGYFDFKLLDVRCAKHYIILSRKPLADDLINNLKFKI